MDFAGSRSERFVEQPEEAQMSQMLEPALGATAPMPPLAAPASTPLPEAEAPLAPTLEVLQPPPAQAGPVSVFRVDQERLTALQDLTWRRVRIVLWIVAVGVALGFLLLLPVVHLPPPTNHPATGVTAVSRHPIVQPPFWAAMLFGIGVGIPVLALGLGVLALPVLLCRAAWLRRQQSLHLAIGRQGLLFFLPGQMERWFLLPWGHITALTDVSTPARTGRRERLRTVLWRRWARLQRAFRHGRRLDKAETARAPVRSPFLLHVRAAGPQQRLRVVCFARLPDSRYGWLFTLAPFTRRVGATTFVLRTSWFESAVKPQNVSLHQVLLGLWASSLARAQRSMVPLPNARGAVLLGAPAKEAEQAPRRVDGPAWVALPLVPVLSVVTVAIALLTHQPLTTGALLNLATLCTLTLGLGLLLAGIRWPTQGRLFVCGACLLGLAGALNLVYAVVVLLREWSWSFQVAPSQPLLFLEALAGLLLMLGGVALGLEGSGRPGIRAAVAQSTEATLSDRLHCTELVVALGLLALGLGRLLEDIDRAALSSNATPLLWLRNSLAEPLLPLAIIGLSYFIALAGPALQSLFRTLQMTYGLVLGLLVPAAFFFVYRVAGGTAPLPLEWLPLMALVLVCGLLAAFWSCRSQRPEQESL